jgi:hypothetical protein
MVLAIHIRTNKIIRNLGCLRLSRLRLETILHGIQVSELVGILTQAPSHDTTEILLRNNFLELAGNQFRGIPGPENVVLLVKVVLAAGLVIGLAIFLSLAPRINDGDALAGTIVRETASLAEVIAGTTISLCQFQNTFTR